MFHQLTQCSWNDNLLILYFQWFCRLNYWHVFLSFPGKFGAGIQSYFSFLRFLVLLNFIIFILMFSVVTLPSIISKYGLFNSSFAKIPPKSCFEVGRLCSSLACLWKEGLSVTFFYHKGVTKLSKKMILLWFKVSSLLDLGKVQVFWNE